MRSPIQESRNGWMVLGQLQGGAQGRLKQELVVAEKHQQFLLDNIDVWFVCFCQASWRKLEYLKPSSLSWRRRT